MKEQKIGKDRRLGDNIRRLRIESGFSQEGLCKELQLRGCDVGRSTYAKYEYGELNIPTSVFITLREIFGCSYDAFFAGLNSKKRV